MINGALKIFAMNGYRKASTDDIVKEAGISKGLLFHYFESKLGVYSFVCQYSARYISMELLRAVGIKETDFFELQKQIELAKMRIMKQYPYMQYFLKQASNEHDTEAAEATKEDMEYAFDAIKKVYEKADMTRFKEHAAPSVVMKMTLLALDGLQADFMKKETIEPEVYYKEACEYLDLLKEYLQE